MFKIFGNLIKLCLFKLQKQESNYEPTDKQRNEKYA